MGYLEWKYPSKAALLAAVGKPDQVWSASATALGSSPIKAS